MRAGDAVVANSLPTVSQVFPPSSDRWTTWPCHPVDWEAYSRFGSTGDAFRWYISHPANSGPSTFQSSRVPSDVRMNAPFRVPTRSRTPLIDSLLLDLERPFSPMTTGGPRFRPRQGVRRLVTPELIACAARVGARMTATTVRQPGS